MARDLLKACGLTPAQVDLIAVAAGPGSFTGAHRGGHRQGLGLGGGEALRRLLHPGLHGLEPGGLFRPGVCGHGCPPPPDLQRPLSGGRNPTPPPHPGPGHRLGGPGSRAQGTQSPQLVGGDGAQLCYDALTAAGIPPNWRPPTSASKAPGGGPGGACLAQAGQTCPPDQLVPAYHRLSQAERERLAREKAAPAPQNQ